MSIGLLRMGIAASGWRAPLPLELVPGALAAYSLRKLRSGYTGAALRDRRSSDAAEQDTGFSGGVDFDDAAHTAWVGAGSGYAARLYGQAAGHDAAQATTTLQPQVALGAVGGRASLLYDHVRYLDAGDVPALEVQAFTMFVVASRSAAGEFQGLVNLQAAINASGARLIFGSDNKLGVYLRTPSRNETLLTPTTYTDTAARLFVVRRSGTSVRLWEGTTLRIDATTTESTILYSGARRTLLGAYWSGSAATNPHRGYLPEAILCGSALSDADRLALSADIAAYYSL